jgi:hypothetical protein
LVAEESRIPSNYSGRVLQRSAFRSLVGRRRTPGSAISSVLTGLRKQPPQPRRPESSTIRSARPGEKNPAGDAT